MPDSPSPRSVPLELDAAHFPEEGIYLLFSDGKRLELVKRQIEATADEYWADPVKIPPRLRAAADFQPCRHCPHHGQDALCKALGPLLPYVEAVDEYVSHDRVTAVYRGDDPGLFYVSHTTMQQAVQYLAILAMGHYCEMSERYSEFFTGIIPIMDQRQFTTKLYANIFVRYKGDPSAMAAIVPRFQSEIRESTRCLTNRLKAICKNDVFINAFVNASLLTGMLEIEPEP